MNKKDYNSLDEIDEETDDFLLKFAITYAIIYKLLEQQIDQGLSENQAQRLFKRIQKQLDTLDDETLIYVRDVFPAYYNLSLKNIDKLSIRLGNVKIIQGAEHAIHRKALHKAQNDLYRDLAKRTTYMSNQAKKIIRENSKELLTGMIEQGTSQITIKKQLKDKLLKEGVSSFVDAGRKSWKIDRYADMVVRTKSRILHHEGTINRLEEYQERYKRDGEYQENFDLIQISNHNSSCWCGIYEDKIFSLSGNHPYYPSIETLPNSEYKVLHPNCKHIFLPYMPSLRGQGERVDKKYQNLSIKEINKIHYHAHKKA